MISALSELVVRRSRYCDNVLLKRFKMCGLVLLLVSAVFLHQAESSKILALMTVPAHSHHHWNLVYLKSLADRGHQITYLGVDEYKNPSPNISYIFVDHAYDLYGTMDFTDLSDKSLKDALPELYDWYAFETYENIKQEGFKKFLDVLKTEKFDLVVFDLGTTSFLLGAVDVLGRPPVIGITPFGVPAWSMDYSGTPYPIQHTGHFLTPMNKNLNFWDRLFNAGVFYYSKYLFNKLSVVQDKVAKQVFGPGIRSIAEIEEDMTINLVNVNWATESPFPTSPTLIPIGGLHIKKVQPLPKDLQQFLDSAKDGVIYFSLGTNIQSTYLRENEIERLTTAFKQLAPIKILWKWEKDELPGKPDNVRIGKWLPQNDILAHPNVRLFFTHGGLLSSQEAVYHGVPIVGMPIFLDQHVNVVKAHKAGYAECLTLKGITSQEITETITKVISNPEYKKNVQKLSKIFRDQQNSPLETAIYWTEYAIRHNGAHHLRTAGKNLNWFQNQLYDIALFVISVTLIFVYTITLVIKRIARLICGSKQKPKQH